MNVDLDFETRSTVDLTKCGGWKYAEHSSTQILCMYYKIDDAPIKGWHPRKGEPFPQEIAAAAANPDAMFYAHNAFFERCIWRELLTKGRWFPSEGGFTQITLPDIPRTRWSCSAAVAAAHSIPRKLEKACKAMKTETQKDIKGHRVMLKLAKPRKATKNDKSHWHSKPEDFQTLYEYCADDIGAEHDLLGTLTPLTPYERVVWVVDQKINDRGVAIDIELAEAAMEIHQLQMKQYNLEIAEVTGGAVTAVSQVAKLQSWMSENGVNLGSVDKDALEAIIANEKSPENVREAAKLRREGSKTSVGKYASALRAADAEGRVHDLHLYHGANTGRWAGKLVQTQNLPRGVLADGEAMEQAISLIKAKDLAGIKELGEVSNILSSAIRGMFVAGEGKELVVADYAAIEARTLVWLAQDSDALRIFHEGKDIYIDMAATIYDKTPGQVTKSERQMGKQAILGLGYGMGWRKFMETCAKYGMEITEELAKTVVEKYRRKYLSVKNLWYAIEEAAKLAVETGDIYTVAGRVTFQMRGKFLEALLPSGRAIRYCRPTLKMAVTSWGEERMTLHFWGVNSVNSQWEEQTSYGAKLVENVVQGIARDLLADALINCEKSQKYAPVLHVHDEVVAECDKGTGDVGEFEDLISRLPTWAEGLPLEAEGWVGHRYRK